MKTKRNIISLKNIYSNISLNQPGIILSCTNLDDIFKVASRIGIKEVSVSREEMFMITTFIAANVYYNKDEKINEKALKLLMEGKVDKFMGIELMLEDNV